MFGNNLDNAKNGLKSLVEEFNLKGQKREEKIRQKLGEMDGDIQKLREQIGNETQKLVDAEIEEDAKAQDQASKKLDSLRRQLEDMESKRAGYQTAMASPGLSQDEINRFVAAVTKARQERARKLQDIGNRLKEIDAEIQSLNTERISLGDQSYRLQQNEEALAAKPLMKYIDPEFGREEYDTRMGDYQDTFNEWLRNGKIG